MEGNQTTIVRGYQVEAELHGTVLTVRATGKVGRLALGTDERQVDLEHVTAVSFKTATPMTNGKLEIVDAAGKTCLHFRRRDRDAWAELHAAVRDLTTGASDSTKGVGLIHEDIDGWAERTQAAIAEKKAASDAKKEARRADL